PTVSLGLSHGDDAPTVSLTRCLIDDQGEWKEGAKTLKKKKEALEKIQEVLPISADAAAMLLWGRQDEMSAILETFPSDGHSLLTPALKHIEACDEIVRQLAEWNKQEEEIERGRKDLGNLKREQEQLRIQHRVARDQELADKIQSLDQQIKRVEGLEAACARLE